MGTRLKGKNILVTASAQGIGKACVEAFQEEGARVIASDINASKLDDLAMLPGVETRLLDVMDANEIQKASEEIGVLDVLFNCAGFVHSGKILDAKDDQFDFAVSLNIKSMFHSIQAAIPLMIKKGGGSIINISSVVSSIIGAPNRFIYGTTKAAVIGLTKSVAVDYVKQGIRCNAICPGTVDTPSLHSRLKDTGDYEKAKQDFIARQPLGRIGKAEEIASLALYLSSDESSFVTGQTHIIDGGWSVG